jgi:hypothetical protein
MTRGQGNAPDAGAAGGSSRGWSRGAPFGLERSPAGVRALLGRRGLIVVALGALAAACGDGTGPGADVVPPELVATWVAEPACLPQCGFTLAWVENPADSINVTSTTGLTMEITLTRTGTFRLVQRPGSESTAEVRVAPGMLIVTDQAGVVDTLDYSIAGSYLQLHFRRTFSVIDFNGDGTLDPARARGRFLRR